MSSGPPRLQDYLAHVIEAIDRIDRIERYTAGIDEAEFVHNDMTQDAVIRNLEVIGEASRNSVREHAAFATAHPSLPLSFAYEMRNALAHGYFKVDLGIVWKTIEKDLPALRQQVEVLLDAP